MNEVRVLSDDLLPTDEEEEILIYADFDTVLEDGIFQNNTLLKMIALESEEPFLQIGTQVSFRFFFINLLKPNQPNFYK